MDTYKLLINGALVDGDSTMEVINPATEEVLALCPRASAAQANAAVEAADAAFPNWAATPIAERRSKILKLADLLAQEAGTLARLLTQEQGKPLPESTAEIAYTEAFVRHLATYDLPIQVLEDGPTRRVEVHRKPVGVVAAIIPWNFPILLISFKLPPALLAGNTIVIKPAPTTPLTTLKFGELCAKVFPPGVVNVIADANDLGPLLTQHPKVRKISMTGSTETGRKVMASAANQLKRVTLELGGNDAGIVLDDIDAKAAAPGLFQSAFMNCGQVCIALKRLYVHEKVYDEVVEELSRLAREAVVDDGLKQGTQIGPLQNRAQYEKVQTFLADARQNGTIVAGGEVMDRPGFFIAPTIVRDITDGNKLVDEEQFGPILPVIKFSDDDDAVSRANNSPYGLGGSVWSGDTARAYALAEQIDAGTVWVNKHLDFGPNIPFGGSKQSGIGSELAEEGFLEYTQTRVINIAKAA